MNQHVEIQSQSLTATLATADLRKAIAFARMPICRRTTIPILGALRFQFSPGRLTVMGSDLDFQFEMNVEAECAMPFDFCLSPQVLGRLMQVSDSSDTTISLSAGENGELLHVVSGDIDAKFRTLFPSIDFPAMEPARFLLPEGETPASSISEPKLYEILRNVSPCISTEETRYYLHGIYMHAKKDGLLRAVATDGHRLAMQTTDIPWKGLDAIVPRGLIALLMKFLSPKGNETIKIYGTPTHRCIEPESGSWCIKHKLIDGTFPNYERVIPTPADDISFPLSWAQVRRLVGIGPNFRLVGVKFEPGAGRMSVRDRDFDSDVTVSLPGGRGGDVGFALRYVSDIVRRHGTVRFESVNKSNPARILTEDPSLTLILMPMLV